MPKKIISNSREWALRTVYSDVLGKFFSFYALPDESIHAITDKFQLGELSREQYVETVVFGFLDKPEVLDDLGELRGPFVEEAFNVIIMSNPCLHPGHVEQTELHLEGKKPRRRAIKEQDVQVTFKNIKERLEGNVVGQRAAIDKVVKAVGKGLLRKEKTRPIASLLFAGLSGTGKTLVAKELAKALHPDSDEIFQVNCGEFGESHQISRLTGSPAGYVGYEDGSLLDEFLKPEKIQIVLFDEIEKAHPKMTNFLLAVLEDGNVSGANNTQLDFRNTIIILTSNLGSSDMTDEGVGFGDHGAHYSKGSIIKKIEKNFPVEFINRLTEVVIFEELSSEEALRVAFLELGKLRIRIDHLVGIDWEESVEAQLMASLPKTMGVRPIRRRVEEIESKISELILEGKIDRGTTTSLSLQGGKCAVFSKDGWVGI